MSLIDIMLAGDAGLLHKDDVPFEVERLSKLYQAPFILKLTPVNARRLGEIQTAAISFGSKGVKNVDAYKLQSLTLIEGIKEPSLKDPRLLEHFGVATPADLVGKLFLAGEITRIYNKIQDISGYTDEDDTDAEIKN